MASPSQSREGAPTLSRLASTSTLGDVNTPTSSPKGTKPPKRRRNLLREYYQLDGAQDTPTAKTTDPLDIASPAFDARLCYENYANTLSVTELLKRETDLVSEIRELDSERQALVYNHHHELIEASDTIRKMKARAESLDGALDGLKAALEAVNQLSTSLTADPPPGAQQARALLAEPTATFDPLTHLGPLLALPQTLRSLLGDEEAWPTATKDAQARRRGPSLGASATGPNVDHRHLLWGRWEPALRQVAISLAGALAIDVSQHRAFEDAGVIGASEVADEARSILARARRGSST